MVTVFVRAHSFTRDIINLLHCYVSSCAVGVQFKWVLYCTVLCLLIAGYLDKSSRTGCLQWVHLLRKLPLCGYPPTSVSPFLHDLSDSIKLGRACSSDLYSVLKTKAEIFLWHFMLFTWTIDRHISTCPYFCHVVFAIITRIRKKCVPGALSPPSLHLVTRLVQIELTA